jgi:formate dehydrogenase accessory protein FdhD
MNMSEFPQPAAHAYRVLDVRGVRGGAHTAGQDCVAEEVPVALEFNGVAHAVMMATPADLDDFAYGFSVTEGIVDTASQIYDCEWSPSALGYTLQLTIAASCFARLKEKRRNLTGRTGCGLCGTESLLEAVRQPAPLPKVEQRFAAHAVARAVGSLRERQLLLAVTGATHAAAWCTADGYIELIREDVGRHNALDKLIGALVRSGRPASTGFIAITSRASYEMVQKTAAVGVTLLAAVSGVTGLAVDVAQSAGLTLLGFARGNDISVYSHPERFQLDAQ